MAGYAAAQRLRRPRPRTKDQDASNYCAFVKFAIYYEITNYGFIIYTHELRNYRYSY